jgi:hypothetical protein
MPTTGPSQPSDQSIASVPVRAVVGYGMRAADGSVDGGIAGLRFTLTGACEAARTMAQSHVILLTNGIFDNTLVS